MGKTLISSDIKGNKVCLNCNNYNVCRAGCRVRPIQLYGNLDDVDLL